MITVNKKRSDLCDSKDKLIFKHPNENAKEPSGTIMQILNKRPSASSLVDITTPSSDKKENKILSQKKHISKSMAKNLKLPTIQDSKVIQILA